jgi:hypothetical protein
VLLTEVELMLRPASLQALYIRDITEDHGCLRSSYFCDGTYDDVIKALIDDFSDRV